ncbi:MAG: sugar isomerase [Candidatus Hydrogenedentes bacterium]|nr:sugar isomerase [Candidatus Hydrogenedentota bacterium]
MCCTHLNRREFLGVTSSLLAGAAILGPTTAFAAAPVWANDLWDPQRPYQTWGKPLRVQPVLMYRVPTRREQTSWKSWGGVQSDAAAEEEAARIKAELDGLAQRADFPMEVLPVVKVTSEEAGAQAAAQEADVTVLYPATGSGNTLLSCVRDGRTIVFVRHQSGPVYYWYEALSTRYLRPNDGTAVPDDTRRLSVDDVVVDDPEEVLWRLRAMSAVNNFVGSRIVALGGPMGKYAPDAPDVARQKYGIEIVDVSYDELSRRIQEAFADPARMALAERWTDAFLAIPNTKLSTERGFVVNAFVLYGIFKDFLRENNTPLFTIKECMSTILPMSKTTACLTLGLLNDEGLVAFCESDFVVVPPGIFLQCVTRKPVFMHNSTFPHKGVVTCAHCASPRRFDRERYEPVEIVTHYESEYGAAPKVEVPVGQEVTFIDPEYATGRWVGISGTVEGNPFHEICRSQQDVRIHGNWKKLINEVRDSHWVMAYGNYLKEIAYAAPRIGVKFEDISTTA